MIQLLKYLIELYYMSPEYVATVEKSKLRFYSPSIVQVPEIVTIATPTVILHESVLVLMGEPTATVLGVGC